MTTKFSNSNADSPIVSCPKDPEIYFDCNTHPDSFIKSKHRIKNALIGIESKIEGSQAIKSQGRSETLKAINSDSKTENLTIKTYAKALVESTED